MYREWTKIECPKKYYIWIWKQDWEADQEIDGKMKWGRMEDWLVENGGRKGYITERNGRSSWEQREIVSFCTCQLNEWMKNYDLFLNINQLDALNFIISLFQASTCFEHMCSSSWGQKLYYTVSGIITPIGGRPVHRSSLNLCTGRPPIGVMIPETV